MLWKKVIYLHPIRSPNRMSILLSSQVFVSLINRVNTFSHLSSLEFKNKITYYQDAMHKLIWYIAKPPSRDLFKMCIFFLFSYGRSTSQFTVVLKQKLFFTNTSTDCNRDWQPNLIQVDPNWPNRVHWKRATLTIITPTEY